METDENGNTYREFDDVNDEDEALLVEDEVETAAGAGSVKPSHGACHAQQVMDWLLLERVRHNVILPAGGAGLQRTLRQKFGVKVSLDAASVRKAKKGNKHWTTLIVQVLCQGVDQGCWGRNAVAHMLELAVEARVLRRDARRRRGHEVVNRDADHLGAVDPDRLLGSDVADIGEGLVHALPESHVDLEDMPIYVCPFM